MTRYAPLAAGALIVLAACRPAAPPAVNAIPADTTAAAIVDLRQLRAAPAFASLPPVVRSLAAPLAQARELVVAWNGTDLLLLAAGKFDAPPSGYTMIGAGIAAAGFSSRLDAARKALASGTPNALPFPVSAAEIRAVIRSDGKLPLTGNLANALNLLRTPETTTVTAHLDSTVEIEIVGQCDSAERSIQLEDTANGAVTLARSAVRDPDLQELLHSLRVSRESRQVRVNLVAPAHALEKIW